MSASRPCKRKPFTHVDMSTTLRCANWVMAAPPKYTARAVAFKRVPVQAAQALSLTSSNSGSAKLFSRPLSCASATESSMALRCSRESAKPVPTHSPHQPCLLL